MSNQTNIAIFLITHGSAEITRFMQAVDMFDEGHVLASSQYYQVSYNCEVTLDRAAKLIDQFVKGFEVNQQLVVFCHLIGVKNDNKIELNNNIFPYYSKHVRQISDGKKWMMFDEFLKANGFVVLTTEHKFVSEVSFHR